MRRFAGRFGVLVGSACLFWAAVAAANPVSSRELIGDPGRFDGGEVVYEGELVGSVLSRGDFVWLNLHDGANALGVWASRGLAAPVKTAGNYKFRGDRVRVAGVFHRACPQHGGALDIHAAELAVVEEGRGHSELLTPQRVELLFYVTGAFGCLLIIYFLRTRRAPR